MKNYRTQVLQYRRKKGRRTMFIAIIALAVAGFVVYGYDKINPFSSPPGPSMPEKQSSVEAPLVDQKVELRPELRKPFLVMLVWGGEAGNQSSKGQALLVVDAKKHKNLLLMISSKMFTDLPGFGYSRVSEAVKMGGVTALSAAISNIVQQPVSHYLQFPAEEKISDSGLAQLVLSAKKTNFKPEDQVAIYNELVKNSYDSKAFPSKKQKNKVEPEVKKAEALIAPYFPKKEKKKVEVVILNGSGVPGVAASFAEDLVEEGYQVKETKNADKFNYEESIVVNYRVSDAEASKVLKILGTGKKETKATEEPEADIVVIVGKDYRI